MVTADDKVARLIENCMSDSNLGEATNRAVVYNSQSHWMQTVLWSCQTGGGIFNGIVRWHFRRYIGTYEVLGLPYRERDIHPNTLHTMELGFKLVLSVFYCILLTVPSLCKGKDVKPVSSSLELQCPPCDRMHCTPKKPKNLRGCKGGITKGICNCCPVCAKVEGEQCGGESDYRGKCDVGLICKPIPTQIYGFRKYSKHWKPEGICTIGKQDNPF